ncbi:hypothetical protein P7C71_g984, partial [Lecanoromycetidae sp. Uapishka_2]
MPSAVANEDHPMGDASSGAKNTAVNGEDTILDINEGPRIRVVSRLIEPITGHEDTTTVYDALEKGFDDLMGLCDVVIDNFAEARDEFNAKQQA